MAQAPPDAVCRWVGTCSELPLPWPLPLPRALQGQGQTGVERKRETKKDRDTDLYFLGDFSLPIREGEKCGENSLLMFLSRGTVTEWEDVSYTSEGEKDFPNPFTPTTVNPCTVSQSGGMWGCPFGYILGGLGVCVCLLLHVCACLLRKRSLSMALVGMRKCE